MIGDAHPHRLAAGVAAPFALTPAVAHAQALAASPVFELPILRLVLGLVLCSACALLLALYLKRRMGRAGALPHLFGQRGSRARHVAVLETHRLSLHADACRLACDGVEYLIVVSQGGALLLREQQIDPAREPGASP